MSGQYENVVKLLEKHLNTIASDPTSFGLPDDSFTYAGIQGASTRLRPPTPKPPLEVEKLAEELTKSQIECLTSSWHGLAENALEVTRMDSPREVSWDVALVEGLAAIFDTVEFEGVKGAVDGGWLGEAFEEGIREAGSQEGLDILTASILMHIHEVRSEPLQADREVFRQLEKDFTALKDELTALKNAAKR